jgi:flagellar assembly factor FliW
MIFTLKSPILGFEQIEKVRLEKVDENFAYLYDEGDSGIVFTLLNPYSVREYSFDLPINMQTLLEITTESKVHIYNILALGNPGSESVVNFLAPLVFNEDSAVAAQVVLRAKDYPDFPVAQRLGDLAIEA